MYMLTAVFKAANTHDGYWSTITEVNNDGDHINSEQRHRQAEIRKGKRNNEPDRRETTVGAKAYCESAVPVSYTLTQLSTAREQHSAPPVAVRSSHRWIGVSGAGSGWVRRSLSAVGHLLNWVLAKSRAP